MGGRQEGDRCEQVLSMGPRSDLVKKSSLVKTEFQVLFLDTKG